MSGLHALEGEERLFVDGRLNPAWAAAFIGFVTFIIGPTALLATTFGVLSAGLEAQTGWAHGAVAYGATLISLTLVISAPLHGFLIDRFGARPLILICTPLYGFSLAALTFVTIDIRVYYAACVLIIFTSLGLWPASFMKILASWFRRRLGLAIATVMVGASVSTIVMPAVLGRSFSAIGWGPTYGLIGALVILVVWPALIRWMRPGAEVGTDRIETTENVDVGFPAFWRAPTFWIGVVIFLGFGLANAAILAHGVALLRWHGLDASSAIALQSSVGAGLLFGRLAAGWLLDRTDVRWVAVVMFAVLTAAFALHLSSFAASSALVLSILGGLVIGAEFDILGVFVRRHFPARRFGRVYGLIFAAFNLGNAVGVAVLAYAFQQQQAFAAPLIGLVAVSVICAALCFRIPGDRPIRAR